MLFSDFLILERKTWGQDVLYASKVARIMMNKILKGDLSLYSHNNSFKVELPFSDLTIKLKAFNNYKKENYSGSEAFFVSDDGKGNAVIELFIFEIFREMKNFRGKKLEDLNKVLYAFVKNNFTTKLLETIAHELEHAFESDRGIYSFSAGNNNRTEIGSKNYYNETREINARIIEQLINTNFRWAKHLNEGVWQYKYPNKDVVTRAETQSIVAKFKEFKFLSNKNRQRFIKGIYTTLQLLWDHYNVQSNKNGLKRYITQRDIEKMVGDKF